MTIPAYILDLLRYDMGDSGGGIDSDVLKVPVVKETPKSPSDPRQGGVSGGGGGGPGGGGRGGSGGGGAGGGAGMDYAGLAKGAGSMLGGGGKGGGGSWFGSLFGGGDPGNAIMDPSYTGSIGYGGGYEGAGDLVGSTGGFDLSGAGMGADFFGGGAGAAGGEGAAELGASFFLADGGAVRPGTRGVGRNRAVPRGLVHSDGAGRADSVNARVPAGGFVMPADIVSGLGQGNTLAGGHMLDQMVAQVPKPPPGAGFADGGTTTGAPVDIRLSGGEYYLPPHVVSAIGNGDHQRGGAILNNAVKHLRTKFAERQRRLPPPKA
jgi:hypothetical protein